MNEINAYLNTIGPMGSENRLRAIASLDLSERSAAAKRALNKRTQRKELMQKGLPFERACRVINQSPTL